MVYKQQPQLLFGVFMDPHFQINHPKREKKLTKNKSEEGVRCPSGLLQVHISRLKRAYTEAKKETISVF